MKKLTVIVCCLVTEICLASSNQCQGPDSDGKAEGRGQTAQSCDPNEISGPLGIGERRYVQQGEWMNYTIYFENKTNATAAAQEVFVDLPMDENLDWSTLELGEIAFGDHTITKLSGKRHGKAIYAMPGTNTFVWADVRMKNGVLSWYLRDWDPTTRDNFPASATGGFLPPNDPETHCGEGHLSYRVRVKDDAPNGAVINASATIVFDSNAPIETDPSWWNTVGTFYNIALELGGTTTNLTLIAGEPFGELPEPANAPAGYSFDAWYTGPNGTGTKATPDAIVPEGDFSLYANWTANEYIVVYNANGGEGEMPLQTNTYDFASCLVSNAFVRASHRFVGWATTENGEVVYEDGAVVSNLTAVAGGVADLYAMWELITMEVAFDLNYMDAVDLPPQSIVVTNAMEYGMLPDVVREGYTFDGWANGKAPRSAKVAAETIVTNETDHTLYAQWTPNAYTVRFNAGGGSGVMPDQSLTYDCSSRLSRNAFFYARHTFCGWATNETGDVIYENEAEVLNLATEPNAVVDLYAVWDEGVFAVEFVERAVARAEGDVVLVRVGGGNADKASSVDVYLTYNTATTADLDLAKGAVGGVVPKGGLKFPLTLSWAKGEVGEKVISIPVKKDMAVEGDEFLTLQLANAKGIELGEERVCTVTVKDANSYVTLQDGVMNPGVKVTTSGDGNWLVGSGSPADIDGVAQFYNAESPSLAQGKSSTLAFGPVKGFGVLRFRVRFTGAANEEEPSSLVVYCDKYNIGTLYNSAYLKEWRSYSQEISSSSLSASHNYSFVFKQGSNPDVHAEIAEVYWDYMGTVFPSTFYTIRTYPSNPAGGTATGSGFYTYGEAFKLAAKSFPGWTFDGWYELVDVGETGERSYFFWDKSPTVSYRINRDIVIEARFSKIPYVRALADPADGGKVTGSGPCAAGKKVTLKATANKNFTFLGWRQGTADGFVATTPSLVIDRTAKPAASTKTSTTITNITEDVTYYAVFKSYPEVFVTVDATDGAGSEPTGKGAGKYVAGTITGMGKYAISKTKIALKATANKGYVFSGWCDANGVLLTKDATYTIAAMGEDDVEYTAKFITVDEDKASIKLSVSGEELRRVEDDAPYQVTNFCGVAMNWRLAADALSATTIKVAGLPSGLKFTAKDVVDAKTKQVTVPANTVYGVPTAASKVDARSKQVVPSKVVFTVTTAGKSTQAFAVNLYVDPLPAWSVGTFDGEVGNGESGTVTLTVAASGKISGKTLEGGKTWTLSATSFDEERRIEGNAPYEDDLAFLATVIGKAGREVVTNEVTVSAMEMRRVEDNAPYQVGVVSGEAPVGRDDPIAPLSWTAYQNLWKRADTKADMPVFKTNFDRTLELGEPGDAGNTVKLTFKKDGVVSFAGKVSGVAVSGTSQLVLVRRDGAVAPYQVTLYVPPKAAVRPPFDGWCETFPVAITVDDANVVTDVSLE